MNLLRMVARPLLAAPFIADGWSALRHPDEHVAKARTAVGPLLDTVPVLRDLDEDTLTLATRVTGALTIGAAVALATGHKPRTAATVLTVIAVPMALINHPVWAASSTEERAESTRGLRMRAALVGGMILAAVDREGRPSALWRYGNWRDHRAEIAQVRSDERERALLRQERASARAVA